MILPADIVFVRHGESLVNDAKRRSDKGDHAAYTEEFRNRHTRSFGLTELGKQQATRAGKWIIANLCNGTKLGTNTYFDYYVVSEYVRALETAALLGIPSAEWTTSFTLVERDWGPFDSLSETERLAHHGDALKKREVEPFFWRAPHGETFTELCLRVSFALESLSVNNRDKRVLVVCHGEVMWAVRFLLENMTQKEFKESQISKAREVQIWNGQILHYSRRDPSSGKIQTDNLWMRTIRPTEDPAWVSDWKKITSHTYSNDELLQLASSYK